MASSWEDAALAAAKRAGAFCSLQVIELLRKDSMPEDQLDDVCEQYRLDFPCLFKARIVDGISC